METNPSVKDIKKLQLFFIKKRKDLTLGIFWYSEAEIVSLEPDVVKDLIEEIAKSEDVAGMSDLQIKENSIFFNSRGYGCYGTHFECPGEELFRILFELYDGALIAFEHVHPCQGQGYHFNALWVKPEGMVDWDDNTTFYQNRQMMAEQGDLIDEECFVIWEGSFDNANLWHIDLSSLEGAEKKNLAALFALVQKAKTDGFDNWIKREGNYRDDNYITFDLVCDLMDKYWDESGDNELAPFDDIEWYMKDWIKWTTDFSDDIEFEMPDNFPELQTTESHVRFDDLLNE